MFADMFLSTCEALWDCWAFDWHYFEYQDLFGENV